MSAAETATNYVVGYFLAWFLMTYLLRWLGYPITKEKSGEVVAIFTAVSVIRSYAIRRFFNWIHVRANMNRTLIHPLDKRV